MDPARGKLRQPSGAPLKVQEAAERVGACARAGIVELLQSLLPPDIDAISVLVRLDPVAQEAVSAVTETFSHFLLKRVLPEVNKLAPRVQLGPSAAGGMTQGSLGLGLGGGLLSTSQQNASASAPGTGVMHSSENDVMRSYDLGSGMGQALRGADQGLASAGTCAGSPYLSVQQSQGQASLFLSASRSLQLPPASPQAASRYQFVQQQHSEGGAGSGPAAAAAAAAGLFASTAGSGHSSSGLLQHSGSLAGAHAPPPPPPPPPPQQHHLGQHHVQGRISSSSTDTAMHLASDQNQGPYQLQQHQHHAHLLPSTPGPLANGSHAAHFMASSNGSAGGAMSAAPAAGARSLGSSSLTQQLQPLAPEGHAADALPHSPTAGLSPGGAAHSLAGSSLDPDATAPPVHLTGVEPLRPLQLQLQLGSASLGRVSMDDALPAPMFGGAPGRSPHHASHHHSPLHSSGGNALHDYGAGASAFGAGSFTGDRAPGSPTKAVSYLAAHGSQTYSFHNNSSAATPTASPFDARSLSSTGRNSFETPSPGLPHFSPGSSALFSSDLAPAAGAMADSFTSIGAGSFAEGGGYLQLGSLPLGGFGSPANANAAATEPVTPAGAPATRTTSDGGEGSEGEGSSVQEFASLASPGQPASPRRAESSSDGGGKVASQAATSPATPVGRGSRGGGAHSPPARPADAAGQGPAGKPLSMAAKLQQAARSSAANPPAPPAAASKGKVGGAAAAAKPPPDMPGRFRCLPPAVQVRIAAMTRENHVVMLKDFDEKVISKMSTLIDRFGTSECVAMLDRIEEVLKGKAGRLANGPGYLDVSVSTRIDELKQRASGQVTAPEDYARSTLHSRIYSELRDLIEQHSYLEWDHFDQGIINMLKKMPNAIALERLNELAYHSFKNVDNVKSCIVSIFTTKPKYVSVT